MIRSRLSGSSLPDALAYGGHSIYLFSTLDNPVEESLRTPPQVLSPNSKRQKTVDGSPLERPGGHAAGDAPSTESPFDHGDAEMDESGDRGEREGEEEGEEDDAETKYSEIPMVLPRRSFNGISNLRTIKDGTVFVSR